MRVILLITSCLCLCACRTTDSTTAPRTAPSERPVSSNAEDKRALDDQGFESMYRAYYKDKQPPVLHLTHDTLSMEGETVNIANVLESSDAESFIDRAAPFQAKVNELLEAVERTGVTEEQLRRDGFAIRVGRHASYEQFTSTLYSLGQQGMTSYAFFIAASDGRYHALPMNAPKLSFFGEPFPAVTIHNTDECSERTLIRLGAEYGKLTQCIERHKIETRTLVKLYARARSNAMGHSYTRAEHLSEQSKACVSNVLDSTTFNHEIEKTCRPSIALGYRMEPFITRYYTVNVEPGGLSIGHAEDYAAHCELEDASKEFCLSETKKQRAIDLLGAWQDALQAKELDKADRHVSELEQLLTFENPKAWIRAHYKANKDATDFGPVSFNAACDPAYPTSVCMHVFHRFYDDRAVMFWDEEFARQSLLGLMVWAISS